MLTKDAQLRRRELKCTTGKIVDSGSNAPTWTNFDPTINKTLGKDSTSVQANHDYKLQQFKNSVCELAYSVQFILISISVRKIKNRGSKLVHMGAYDPKRRIPHADQDIKTKKIIQINSSKNLKVNQAKLPQL